VADPAARRAAEEALARWDTYADRPHSDARHEALYACVRSLRALLAEQGAGGADPRVSDTLRFADEVLSWLKWSDGALSGWPAPGTIAKVRESIRHALSSLSHPAPSPARDEVARLTALLHECNAVCLCGCPDGDHEADECGESCEHDDHECLRVPKSVLAYVETLRRTPARDEAAYLRDQIAARESTIATLNESLARAITASDEVREAAEALLRYHDACGMESSYGGALRTALAKRGGE